MIRPPPCASLRAGPGWAMQSAKFAIRAPEAKISVMVQVKVCGITSAADAAAAVEAGAAALGFNFYRRSPRYIEPTAARRIIAGLPAGGLTVRGFVDEPEPTRVAAVADAAGGAAGAV